MAKVSNNIIISGLRGRVGNQLVFRLVNGVTIVSRAPEKSDRRKETEAQRKTRTTFRTASQWAKAQLVNPEKKCYYIRLAKAWNLTNAYTAAVKDYMCNAGKPSMTSGATATADVRTRQRAMYERPQLLSILPVAESATDRIPDVPAWEWLRDTESDSALSAFRSYCDRYGPAPEIRQRLRHHSDMVILE